MNNNIKAVLLTISASFFAVLMEALIKAAQYDSNVYTIGFFRFFFGFLIILPYLVTKKFNTYKTKNLKFYIIRGAFNISMQLPVSPKPRTLNRSFGVLSSPAIRSHDNAIVLRQEPSSIANRPCLAIGSKVNKIEEVHIAVILSLGFKCH